MKATQVKICGIDTAANARIALAAGAHALGLVFAPVSARCLTLEQARNIADAVRGEILLVGMFVDQQSEFVAEAVQSVGLEVLQFHGAETPAYCASFDLPYIKAFRAGIDDASWVASQYEGAWGWLLDTADAAGFGGTGKGFDLSLWPRDTPGPWMLAGGLTAANVGAAIATVRPWYVDVSGGVESGVRGVKDPARIVAFIEAVQAADALVASE